MGRAGDGVAGDEGSEEDEEFADEAVEAGECDGGEDEEDGEEAECGHASDESADLVHVAGVVAFIDHSDDEEECPGGESVVDHVEDGAGDAFLGEGEHAEDAEGEVGDGGVGDEFFHIALGPGDEGTVDDSDDADDRRWRGRRSGWLRGGRGWRSGACRRCRA